MINSPRNRLIQRIIPFSIRQKINAIMKNRTLSLDKIPLRGHQDWVTSVDGSKNGKRVISGSRDGSIRYWNIERLDEIPLVIENKREKGIRTENCAKCCKPFSGKFSNLIGY